MRAPLRTKGHLAHPRHDSVECQLRSIWLKILGLTPQSSWHTLTGRAMCTLWYHRPPHPWSHSQKPTHRTHAYTVATISDALLILPAGIRLHMFNVRVCVCFRGPVWRRWGGVGGWDDRSCGANVLTAPDEWHLLWWWWRGNELEAFPTHSSHLNDWNLTVKKTSEPSRNKVAFLLLYFLFFLYFISLIPFSMSYNCSGNIMLNINATVLFLVPILLNNINNLNT